MAMQAPDFARLEPPRLEQRDLLFLFEHFPVAGVNAVEAARRVMEQPNTLESLLESRYVGDAILDRRTVWLEVSPRLFFNVLLRRALRGRRDAEERNAIHYLANLLGLFVSSERLYRVDAEDSEGHEYLVDLVAEAAQADDDRRFLIHSHIGNYALFLSGIFATWIEHRYRYRRRPVTLDYYTRMGRAYYTAASGHWQARRFNVHGVFTQLARRFDYYREGLERIAADHLQRQSPLAT
jgi:hypothetical protein